VSGRFCLLRQRQRLEATAGGVRARWDQGAGGTLQLRAGDTFVAFEAEIGGSAGGHRVVLRQSNDRVPRLLPLEEGSARVGVRALYGLYDEDERLHGDGLQETWITRHGEIFLSFGVRLVPQVGLTLTDALVRCSIRGLSEPLRRDGARLWGRGGDGSLLLGWPVDRGRCFDTVRWRATRPPFYERWPPFFDQWSLAPESFGWDRRKSGGVSVQGDASEAEVELGWFRDDEVAASPSLDLRGLGWCGLGEAHRVRQLLDAHERPMAPQVTRGTLRCYDELDGAFEVAADVGGRCELELPADPHERPTRIRVYGLAGSGGYEIEPAGTAQLSSGDARTDDPLVTVPTEADRPADEVLLDLVGRRESPTRIVVRPRRGGLHIAYQRRDPQRRLTVHHTLDPVRAVCTVDLSGVRLRGLRLPGAERPALHDVPLYWMRYLAKASAHSANQLEQVEILEAGPEQVALTLHSTTPNGLVQSRYELTFPYAEDRIELVLRASLTGASAWDLPTFEYADLFPADGITPADWDYRRIAFVGPDSIRVHDPRDPYPVLGAAIALPAPALEAMQAAHASPDAGPWSFADRAALVFHGSARGTILAVATNPDGAAVEHIATLCEHWMDVHLDVATAGRRPVSAEAEQASGRAPMASQDELTAELHLQLLDPQMSFEDVLLKARSLVTENAVSVALS